MIPLKDNLRCATFALATLIIIVLNCAAFVVELMVFSSGAGQHFISSWAMTPGKISHAFAAGDPLLIAVALLTVLTAMFLHGGWLHLIGNMLYFCVFGRAVEARLGAKRFLCFYLISGVVAALVQLVSNPGSVIPVLGASGAIAGVLGGYLLFYPQSEVKGLILLGLLPLPVSIRAYWFLLFWFGMQVIEVLSSTAGTASGGVAYYAHIGGFLSGVLMALLVKKLQPVSNVCYIPQDCDCPVEKKLADPDEFVE